MVVRICWVVVYGEYDFCPLISHTSHNRFRGMGHKRAWLYGVQTIRQPESNEPRAWGRYNVCKDSLANSGLRHTPALSTCCRAFSRSGSTLELPRSGLVRSELSTWLERHFRQTHCTWSVKEGFRVATLLCGNFHPPHRRLTSERLAERPKSRRESGQNTPILKFWVFGRLFQFLGQFWSISAHIETV